MKRLLGTLGLVAMLVYMASHMHAVAQTAAKSAPPASTARESAGDINSFWGIVTAGGYVGVVILLLSVAAAALVFEHLISLRERKLIPPGLADEVRTQLAAGQLGAALAACRQQPSALSTVLEAGLVETDGGWPAVEKAMEDTLADQSARLLRKIDYLSVIGNIAPMLGLLGTVVGMVMAFREVAVTQGVARPADLAEGIYLALVTTVEGLIVAIPALAAFAFFRNRVDQLLAEVTLAAQHAFVPLRQTRSAPRRVTPIPPPVEGRM